MVDVRQGRFLLAVDAEPSLASAMSSRIAAMGVRQQFE